MKTESQTVRNYVKHRRYTVGVLKMLIHVEHASAAFQLDRFIDYSGPGWYSLMDDDSYSRGFRRRRPIIYVGDR